ncbi:MAG TPA: hypothetical protein VFA65_21475 [Bryobacteraceae bacterium]|nr:hypothetical protein [Bryobacteraceae bacterium]
MPKLKFVPSDEDRERVRELASTGAAVDDIAAQMRLPLKKLQRLFRNELQQGAAEGKQSALDKLKAIALSGDNISALIFWVKANCGWRDTGAPGNSGSRCYAPIIFKMQKV